MIKDLHKHPAVVQTLGAIGHSYQEADSDLRDVWHSASVHLQARRRVEVDIHPAYIEDLRTTFATTLHAVQAAVDANAHVLQHSILAPLRRIGDLRTVEHHMNALGVNMERLKTQLMGEIGGGGATREAVDWEAVVDAAHEIARIGRDAISHQNPRQYKHGATLYAESVVVGITLRVGLVTAVRLLHLLEQLHPSRTALPPREAGAQKRDSARSWLHGNVGSLVVSPLHDETADARVGQALRYLTGLAYRGGFGGPGWHFPGDATMRVLQETLTDVNWRGRWRRRLRRWGRFLKGPFLLTLALAMTKLVEWFVLPAWMLSNPWLYPLVFLLTTFLNNVSLKILGATLGGGAGSTDVVPSGPAGPAGPAGDNGTGV